MAFARPTLAELVTRIQADMVSRLDLSGSPLRRSVVYVLARVMAGAAHLLHGHLEFLAKQLFADRAEEEYLLRIASLYGMSKNPATFATADVEVTGTNGTLIPAGTVLLRSDAAEYTTDADATIASGTAIASVTASVAGSAGTLTDGAELAFESPIAGVTSTATVDDATADGSDEESVEALRTRLLARIAEPPHGGIAADYVAWAKLVTGVTRVWVTPLGLGAGTVVVRFVRDGDASPIPDVGEVAAVQAKLEEMAPAHATPTAVAPTALDLDPEIEITPDTAELRAAVEAELEDLILRKGEPGGALLLSAIRTAIGSVPGIEDYDLVSPVADVTHTTNQIPVLGTVTWS
jgi:uncharacterized phage protein gp47/JayE